MHPGAAGNRLIAALSGRRDNTHMEVSEILLIRPICAQDRAFFCTMVQAFYQSPAVCHDIPPRNAERTFEQLMQNTPYADCLIAESDDGQPIGYCLLALTWSNEAGGLCVWLEEILVDARHRSQGLGRKLIAAVREKYAHAARFRLEVTDDNRGAATLYRMLGFETLPYRQMTMDVPS